MAGGAAASSGSGVPWPGAWSPVTLTNSSGGTITYGQLCYIVGVDAVSLAQSDGSQAEATVACIAIPVAPIANGDTGRFVFGGKVITLAGGTTGADGWLNATPGAIGASPDVTAGHYLARAGFWLSTTEFQFVPSIPTLM